VDRPTIWHPTGTGGTNLIPRFRPPHTIRDLGVLFTRKKHTESISDFETSFANAAGQRHARVFPYGRTALVAVLEYLKENSDSNKLEVICPSYTCVVVAHAIVEAGLQPVFVDSEETTLNMDWAYVHQAASENTLAVISTSLFGNPIRKTDIDAFRARFPNIPIVQDCAHSFFAGNVHREGLAAIYGMNISKLITTVFGGMVSTDDKKLAKWLSHYQTRKLTIPTGVDRLFRTFYLIGSLIAFSKPLYWFTFTLQSAGFLKRFVSYYRPDSIDFPKDAYKQIGAVECELGKRLMRTYSTEIRRRQDLAELYQRFVSLEPRVASVAYDSASTYSHFVLRSKYAKKIISRMAKKRIELGRIVDYDISSFPAYGSAPYFGTGVSLSAPAKVLNLPIHRGVSSEVAAKVLSELYIALDDSEKE